VALSRARYGLAIVGNAINLNMDETWSKLITEHYKKRRCYCNFDPSLLPPIPPEQQQQAGQQQ
jgi:superfamily I DNA and/or RNA helicase